MAKGIMLHEVGEQVDQYLLIKSSTKGIASNGKPFLTLMLQDQSGDIEAKLWDAKQSDEVTYAPQTIVKVVGDVHHYRGRTQLKLRNIRPVSEQENVNIDDFLETAPIPKNEMM
ncbi:MAG: 3'-5' exonuclease, partial [Bacillota bacterium]|nr:3'-5' exonuclease [Bacillota bacterium]